jgi:hypothetical protein
MADSKKLIGVRNLGMERSIGGVLLAPEEVIWLGKGRRGIWRDKQKAARATSVELKRYLADWPFGFEAVYEEKEQI